MGRLLILDQNVPHDVEALEESAFLLAIALPGPRHGVMRTAITPGSGSTVAMGARSHPVRAAGRVRHRPAVLLSKASHALGPQGRWEGASTQLASAPFAIGSAPPPRAFARSPTEEQSLPFSFHLIAAPAPAAQTRRFRTVEKLGEKKKKPATAFNARKETGV